MKLKKYTSLSTIAIILFLIKPSTSFAQKEGIKNMFFSTPIKTDGILQEWSDSLAYYNPETKLAYAIGNDNSNLYVAIKTSDPQTIKKLLTFGISFMINKENKKKIGPTITFPIVDKAELRTLIQNQTSNQHPDFNKLNKQIISKVNGIYVNDYKTILDGAISLKNDYGISVGAIINEKNIFCYELTIPFQQLDVDWQDQNPLYCNIKLNGSQRTEMYQRTPMMRNSDRYKNYDDRNIYKRNVSESIDFWIKTSLAKNSLMN